MAENLTDPIKSQLNLEKEIHIVPLLTANVQKIKIQFDVLATFHDISYLSVVSPKCSKCVFFFRKQPQKIGGIVISDKSGLTKDVSP